MSESPLYNVKLRDRDICVLVQLAKHLLLTRPTISLLCYEGNDRVARDRLSKIARGGYIQRKRYREQDSQGAPTFLYMLTEHGCRFLADHFDDARYRTKPTTLRQPLYKDHYLAVSDVSVLVQEHVIPNQKQVGLVEWFNDEEVVNFGELDEDRHHRMYTQLRDKPKKLVVDPDAAFMLKKDEHQAVFFVERERDRNGPKRVAAIKTPGYVEMLRQQTHRRFFPATTLDKFTVLFICERTNHRDRMRVAFSKHPDTKRWRFASINDLSQDSFLFEPVWYLCDEDEPRPIVQQDCKKPDVWHTRRI